MLFLLGLLLLFPVSVISNWNDKYGVVIPNDWFAFSITPYWNKGGQVWEDYESAWVIPPFLPSLRFSHPTSLSPLTHPLLSSKSAAKTPTPTPL